ncbi:MAG TPA: fused protease/ribonucleoside-triphosphate reductase [Acidobacteriota bacterium]|nr:fused protease/ribonucleoside-triphosphate reductase [Acidobacteriota bacterium]
MIVDVDRYGTFELAEEFLAPYRARSVEWGFGTLSWVTYKRTYSRDGEEWWQTCRRVIEGMTTVHRIHCLENRLPWDRNEARRLAEAAYERVWEFKRTPPGRGLWIMGTHFMYERGGAALNNCGFISTKNIASDYADPFLWVLHMSMLGVGVGFDTRGKGSVRIARPQRGPQPHVISDSREGWVEAVGRLLNAYVGRSTLPSQWDFSEIRPRGALLANFGGFASGPEPLREILESLERLYDHYIDYTVDARLIVDTMNIIGRGVVAGGTRRSAQIAFGEPDDVQFLDLKLDREKLREYRWASNNSVYARIGMDYGDIARRTAINGEPGYLWLENIRAYGRMKDAPTWVDTEAEGSNPCVEQSLWDRELCCLVETFPARHQNLEDYLRTLEVAYLYAKIVTLIATHDPRTNAVMFRNRRIGCSMSGIIQAINRLGYRKFFEWCDKAYSYIQQLDAEYSKRLAVPRSIKTTSVKPSGSVSLLAGATPGVHWQHAPYYIRRVRIPDNHPLAHMCLQAGYPIEPDRYSSGTMVVSFPIHVQHAGRRKSDVSLREKIDLAAQMQRYWSDNQVSCTADFNPDSERVEIPRILEAYEDRLKGIAFLPAARHGYEQAPYEEITPAKYEEMARRLKPLEGILEHEHELEARFCEGGVCEFI